MYQENGYKCICVEGFTGKNCETSKKYLVETMLPLIDKWRSLDCVLCSVVKHAGSGYNNETIVRRKHETYFSLLLECSSRFLGTLLKLNRVTKIALRFSVSTYLKLFAPANVLLCLNIEKWGTRVSRNRQTLFCLFFFWTFKWTAVQLYWRPPHIVLGCSLITEYEAFNL